MLYRKIFLNSLIAFLLIQALFHYSDVEMLKYLLYATELSFILFSLLTVIKKVPKLTSEIFYLISFSVLVLFNFFVNQQSQIDDITKIFGGIVIFTASFYLCRGEYTVKKNERIKLIFIALLPFFIFVIDTIFGYKESENAMSIFSNSNNYIFFSICCIWLMMLYDFSRKLVLSFTALSLAVTSTLGAFLALNIAAVFYFRKKIFSPQFFIFFSIAASVGIILIIYSDLYLFERIRGTANVFYTLISDYNINEFADIGFGDAMAMSGSNDGSDVSFLFRIKIWTESLTYFLNQNIIIMLFGLGFGATPEINSFGLVAHNDYLTWLIEFGFFGFTLIVYGIWKGFLKLKDTIFIIPYLAILIYFFTENLFYNFFAIAIFSFCLALTLQKIKNENFTD